MWQFFPACRSSNRPTGCRLQMYPLKYPVACRIAFCAMMHKRLSEILPTHECSHFGSCVCSIKGIRMLGATWVFEPVHIARAGDVPLNQRHLRTGRREQRAFRRPYTFSLQPRATPRHTTLEVSLISFVLGKSCLQISSLLVLRLTTLFEWRSFFLQ